MSTSETTTSVEPLAGRGAPRSAGSNGVEVDPKRLLGAFYTPESLAGILVRWALKGVTGSVLDPSFGGCAFLTAATKELKRKGEKNPGLLVFGVDVDPDCIEHVRGNTCLAEENCVVRDFLDLAPGEMPGAPFKVIVGNPPFVRHHWLKGEKRAAARAAIDTAGIAVPATASTWAYFLVHSLAFLESGGRLAMLVPEAILQADYAAPIREALAERFSRVLLVHIRDRLFEGTDEPVVVVAAAGYGKRGKITIEAIQQAEDLAGVLSGSTTRRRSSRVTVANGRTVSAETVELLEELEQHELVRRVADVATVRIGFVTGANNHFIRAEKELARLGIPSRARIPVVARTKWLSGLEFTKEDHRELVAAGRRAFLVRPTPRFDDDDGVRAWIVEGEAVGVKDRSKCSRREDWYRLVLPPIPDAFATCTRLGSPLIVINSAGYRCSNALHSIRWKEDLGAAPGTAALGFLTSLVSVWAELHGRRYGGGVLKVEPGTLNSTPLPLVPSASEFFEQVNALLRAGREEDARRRADEVVLGMGLGLSDTDIRRLERARHELAAQRRPADRGGQHG